MSLFSLVARFAQDQNLTLAETARALHVSAAVASKWKSSPDSISKTGLKTLQLVWLMRAGREPDMQEPSMVPRRLDMYTVCHRYGITPEYVAQLLERNERLTRQKFAFSRQSWLRHTTPRKENMLNSHEVYFIHLKWKLHQAGHYPSYPKVMPGGHWAMGAGGYKWFPTPDPLLLAELDVALDPDPTVTVRHAGPVNAPVIPQKPQVQALTPTTERIPDVPDSVLEQGMKDLLALMEDDEEPKPAPTTPRSSPVAEIPMEDYTGDYDE